MMTGEVALDLLRTHRKAKQGRDLAVEIGVSEATVSRWLAAKSPPEQGLKRLVEWAERQPVPVVPVVDLLVTAQQATAENIVQLSRISGYATAVWEMMQTVTDKQGEVVRALEPWVLREKKAVLTDEQAKASTKQLEAKLAQMRETEAQSSRQDTDAEASHTPAVHENAATEGEPQRDPKS